MFEILTYLVERIRDLTAKKGLEEKLGRRVSGGDIYSLKTNIEAAEADQGTAAEARAATTPVTPPYNEPKSRTVRYVVLSVIGIFLIAGGTFLVIAMMPESTYDRLNPFTPKVADGTFPPTIGDYQLKEPPTYRSYREHCKCYGYLGIYKKGTESIGYNIYTFDTPEEARKNFEGRSFIGGTPRVTEQTDSRQVIVDQKVGNVVVQLTHDNQLVYFAHNKGGGVNFENDLPYAALGFPQPPSRSAE